MKKVIANFKMNKTASEMKEYLISLVAKFQNKHELVLCMPFTNLGVGEFMLRGQENIKLGAQNICDEEEDKCTGEISGKMLKDAGAQYVIVGHSERRTKFKEGGKSINKKIQIALKNGIKVILCIGETLADRNTLKIADTLRNQLTEALKGLYENELENITVAYEPIWAIGSGRTPLPKEIETVGKIIRKAISEDFSPKAGKEIKIVYGGSVNQKNAASFCKCSNIDGVLVGGGCLDCDNFLQILSVIPQ